MVEREIKFRIPTKIKEPISGPTVVVIDDPNIVKVPPNLYKKKS